MTLEGIRILNIFDIILIPNIDILGAQTTVPATALVPLILFPLMGVLDGKATAKSYFSDTQFVFIGSFLLAVAIEEAQLHRRYVGVAILCACLLWSLEAVVILPATF